MAEVLSRGKKHILGESCLFFEQQMKRFDGNSGSSSSSMYVSGSSWTSRENKLFEKALAMYDSKTPDRWQKVVAMIPGKTASDAFKHYQELEADVNCIEAGLIDIPSYSNSTFTLELGSGDHHHDGLKNFTSNGSKRGGVGGGRGGDQERKKGVPWTEEEHRLFLLGLEKYGKGDWRNISRNFVVTKTPTQVASHAQKYFIRLSSGSKDKRRSSIHDITTVNITDKNLPSLSRSQTVPSQSVTVTSPRGLDGFKLLFDQNSTSEGTSCLSSPTCQPQGKFSLPYPVNPFLNTAETHHLSKNMIHELQLGMQDHKFQIQQHPFGGYNE